MVAWCLSYFLCLSKNYTVIVILYSSKRTAFYQLDKKKKDFISLCLDVKKVRENFLQRQRKYLPATHTPRSQPPTRSSPLRPGNSLSLSLSVALCVKFSNILRRKIKYENRLDFEALQKKLLSGAENIGLFLSSEIRIQAEL